MPHVRWKALMTNILNKTEDDRQSPEEGLKIIS